MQAKLQDHQASHYSTQTVSQVIQALESSSFGLTSQEAASRIKLLGPNILVEEKKNNIFIDILANFKNPLVLILLFASFISAIFGQNIDAIIIILIVMLSVILNFFQEYSASKAAQKLKDTILTTSTVLRDGKEVELQISQLTIGDVIILNAGDLVPGDARVIEANDFFINQSSLTGESFPAEKSESTLSTTALSLSDMSNVIFTGSNVETGTAKAIIIKTGKQTEFGKIAHTLNQAEPESSYIKGLNSFSIVIMKLTILIVGIVFLINAYLRQDVLQSFLFAVAVAVGLTPELLPVIMSITMAKGSVNMAKKGVIVKKLTAIPNFGSMDMLCTDKTGTLTQDKIQLVKYTDVFGNRSDTVLVHAFLNSSHQTGIKNPMDDAVTSYKDVDVSMYGKVDEIPFDFVRKMMSVVVSNNSEHIIVTKGAPEEVFKQSVSYEDNGLLKPLNEEIKNKITDTYHNLSKEGYRVLAVAKKTIESQKIIYSKADEHSLELIGYVSFLDPAKTDAKETLEQLEKMGIEIKVITGDNEIVTQKICSEVGLAVKGIMLGFELNDLTDDALRVLVEKTTIFARFSPDEKNRVINALKQNNHVVGYMGDGINDAPSLKNADIGISVSNAVDVAKESAKIILTHKSLHELRDGVLEGRKTFGNTLKYVMMGVSSNFGNMFSVIGAVLFLPYLPMLPIQILLNNLLYDFSQITIPSDKVDDEYIQSPKRWDMKFLKHFMFVFGTISSVFDFLTFFILYKVFSASASVFQTGWFLESLATQTLVIYIIRTKKIPFIESFPSKYLVLSTVMAVSVGWILPYTYFGGLFQFTPLPLQIILTLVAIIVVYLVTVEIAKRIFFKKYASLHY
ncbi:MAG: magnesium-translocating P-type ATPase [bacterium]|nr:magnesium-translocating P-type ATPase [bacterium]